VFFFKRGSNQKPPQRATITERKRSAYRASVRFPLVYGVEGRAGTRDGIGIELSAAGLRFLGEEDLPNDRILDFRFTLPDELIRGGETVPPDSFPEMKIRGKTVVAFLDVRARMFAHGVQFIDLDERMREEIQRFIHLWQIRQIRERASLRGE
jgi:c-di-GMP-binding flagellar brake protein YcgR